MKRENGTHLALFVISALTLLGVVASFFCMKRYVNSAIEENEAMKVGGVENYEKLKELYKSDAFKAAQQQQIESAIAQMNGQQPTDTTAGAQEEFPSGKLTAAQMEQIKAGTFVLGDDDAKITIVEYSDPECPFCIRHYNDKTIENVMNKYDGEVNHIIKPVQGVNHTNTEYKSLAMLCAGKLGGGEAFYGMYDKMVGQSTPEAPVAKDKVSTYATELGLNASKFATCVDTKELLSQYSANWQEALAFKSGGTPGNMIINNETGEYRLVAGAYPVDSFTQIIDQWMN